MTLKKLGPILAKAKTDIKAFEFKDLVLPQTFKSAYSQYLEKDKPEAYASIEWKKYVAKIKTSSGLDIFLPNYWFFLAAKQATLIADLKEHKDTFEKVFSDYSSTEQKDIATVLRTDIEERKKYLLEIDKYFTNLTFEKDEKEAFLEVVTDYAAWGGGKTIDRSDFVVSSLMSTAGLLQASQGGIATIAQQLAKRHDLIEMLEKAFEEETKVENSLAEDSHSSLNSAATIVLSKSFLLLAGISGTGKSKFIRAQAGGKTTSQELLLVPVRPDWHEPSDLMGYVSRIGETRYIPTPFLRFIVSAWIKAYATASQDSLTLKDLSQIPTYWVCLDEMNLAPVEQYFADYLSVLETRDWKGDEYTCASLLNPSELLSGEDENVFDALKKSLGLESHIGLWEYFLKVGIPIPPNLIVAGTVNMDETTHGFSRKVIDRALTFDFGNFFPNDFDKYFGNQNTPKTLSFSRYSKATPADLNAWVPADDNGAKSTLFLKEINVILKDTPFELAYRALNELLVSLLCFKPKTDKELLAVWDDFLMCKLLPRLEGDQDKFTKNGTDVLDTLLDFVKTKFPDEPGNPTPRPDLLNTTHDGKELLIAYRSPAKLQWMKNRLSGGFTSFWP